MRRRNRKRDPKYLAFIHEQPCAAWFARCQATGMLDISPCVGRITAHHAGGRGLMQRAEDRTAIPLCEAHHQNGPHAVHVLGKKFYDFHGLNRDEIIATLNQVFEGRV